MSLIRKIAIGPDYKNAIHFFTDQEVLRGTHVIHDITQNQKTGDVVVYIKNTDSLEVFQWKSFNQSMPMSIEYSIDF